MAEKEARLIDANEVHRLIDQNLDINKGKGCSLSETLVREIVNSTPTIDPESLRPQWISVKDRLPDVGSIVLIHQLYSWENNEDGAEITIGRLFPTQKGEKPYWEFQHYRPDFRNRSIMDNDIICPGSEYVTHWMPLPEPPKEVNHDL